VAAALLALGVTPACQFCQLKQLESSRLMAIW
jgi:hypothetical protein